MVEVDRTVGRKVVVVVAGDIDSDAAYSSVGTVVAEVEQTFE